MAKDLRQREKLRLIVKKLEHWLLKDAKRCTKFFLPSTSVDDLFWTGNWIDLFDASLTTGLRSFSYGTKTGYCVWDLGFVVFKASTIPFRKPTLFEKRS